MLCLEVMSITQPTCEPRHSHQQHVFDQADTSKGQLKHRELQLLKQNHVPDDSYAAEIHDGGGHGWKVADAWFLAYR